jgi:hypothetical protein
MALDTIPKQEGGKLNAVASGTLPSGQPVAVNADGTVSVISEVAESIGSAVVFDSTAAVSNSACVFDSSNNKVIIVYESNASGTVKMEYVVGTVSGSSISFGSVGEVMSSNNRQIDAVFDTNSNRIVVVFGNGNDSNHGYAIVGSLSGTTVTWGSATEFKNAEVRNPAITFDSSNNKVVIAYRDQGNSGYGTSVVGTVSNTSISFGTDVVYSSRTAQDYTTLSFDTNANKVVVIYQDSGDTSYGRSNVGTVSGTSISWGAVVIFTSSNTWKWESTFDSSNNKVVAAYRDSGDANKSKAIVGTVSGTSISFGTPVVFSSVESRFEIAFDSNANKVVIIDMTTYSSPNLGNVITGTVSGTDISFTTTQFLTGNANGEDENDICFDSNANKMVLAYTDGTNSDYGTSKVFTVASTNLTSENYIGMSGGVVDVNSVTQALGSAVVFESATVSSNVASTFDSNSNKVVIVYQDTANSFFGTAVVGTVSGTSISFGTPVVFSSANRTQEIQITFDSNSNKVVIAYDDKADGQQGKAIVGTVSGTSISFGSAVVFNNGSTDMGTPNAITFDSNSNKVVIAFKDKADTNKGKAIVGTVSGTSISFGSEATFLNADYANDVAATFDSNSNKVVIVYKDGSNSLHGYAVVGTVSSTSISFGTPVVFESAETNKPNVTFDTVNNKIVIAYADGTVGTAIVGTVSGTSISFGSPVIFNSTETSSPRVRFDATASKIVIAYGEGSGNAGTFKTGTVSGTSISFDSATVFESGSTNAQNGLVYDSSAGKMVLSYYSGSNSGYGTSKVLQTGHEVITRGQVADGGNATVDIVGAVSANQLSLTAGQQYFVQTDGTLGLTAADPGVLAGTAISATKMLVKT